MSNLYEINEKFNNLINVLENEILEDDIKETVKSELNNLEAEASEKVENIVKYIKNLESDISAFKEEEKQLSLKRKVTEKKVDNLKGYLFDFTKLMESKKIKGGIFTVSIKKNPQKLIIDDSSSISDEYIKIIKEVDKTKLKKALKEGLEFEGVKLIQEESLKIN